MVLPEPEESITTPATGRPPSKVAKTDLKTPARLDETIAVRRGGRGAIRKPMEPAKLVALLDKLKAHDTENHFSIPVDGDRNLAYHKEIKNPMDLGTMGRKLQTGDYTTEEDFESDFKLIVSNCPKFNPPQDDITNRVDELQQFFNTEWKKLESSTKEAEAAQSSGHGVELGKETTKKPSATRKTKPRRRIGGRHDQQGVDRKET